MDNTQVIANLRQDLRDHREEIQRLLGVIDDIATERNGLRAILEGVHYLPMDCPNCGRHRLEYDRRANLVKCEKCGRENWEEEPQQCH